MPFERAIIINRDASVGTGIKISLSKVRNASAKMRLSVSDALAKQFGWSDKDKIEVLIGTGSDHGLIRMRKNASTGNAVVSVRKLMKGRTYALINFGHQPAFVDRAEASRWCQFEQVDDGWLEIVLPKWAGETGPAKPKVSATPVAPIPAREPNINVTASLMGDPPPGRRQIMEKIGAMK
jgi:hypothetical protein